MKILAIDRNRDAAEAVGLCRRAGLRRHPGPPFPPFGGVVLIALRGGTCGGPADPAVLGEVLQLMGGADS